MTREDVLAMEPGRELDELIAIKIMKYQRGTHKESSLIGWFNEDGAFLTSRFTPSTDIAAAWKVVEKMQNTPCKDGDHFVARVEGFAGAHEAAFYHHLTGCPGDDGLEYFEARAKTVPEAICKAALLAVLSL